jgi:hypothetical protein
VNVISNRTGQNMVKAQVQLLAALVTGVLATATACSSDSTPPKDSAEATPSNNASSLLVAPEDIEDPSAAAVAAYERYWRTVAESGAIPDPNYGPLSEVAGGEALETARSLAQDALDAGQRATGTPVHDAEVTSMYPETDPHQFVIADCMDSTDWIVVDASTGEPVADEEYGTQQVKALVEDTDGHWRVTDVVLRELGTCLGRPSRGHR